MRQSYGFMSIGENFNDDMGYVRRTNIRKHFVDSAFRPARGAQRLGIPRVTPHARINYYTDQSTSR